MLLWVRCNLVFSKANHFYVRRVISCPKASELKRNRASGNHLFSVEILQSSVLILNFCYHLERTIFSYHI